MVRKGGKIILGLLLALPAWGTFVSAGDLSSASHLISPSVIDIGGRDGASASHNAITVTGEAGGAARSSAEHFLYPGFGNLMAWPERIGQINASTGAAPGEISLSWTSPKADGFTGTAAAYQVRLSSVPADSPALSEVKFFLARSATDFAAVPAPGPAGSQDTLTVGGLVGGATYYFAVKARSSWDAWGYLSAGATAQARLYAPSAAGFSEVYASSVQFSWTDAANVSGLLYRVLVSTAPDPLNPNGAAVTSSDTFNSFISTTGLSGNTTYYFRVAAVNNTSVPPVYSAAAAVATLLANPPASPSFTSATESTIRFDWSENGNAYPGTNYRVVYSTAPDPLAPDGAAVFTQETGERYLVAAGLNGNTTYYFSVAGLNKAGIGTAYTAAAGTSTLAGIPGFAGFTNLDFSAVTFNWTDGGNGPGTRYQVLMSSAPDPLNPSGAVVISSVTDNLSYNADGLNDNTSYYFTVAGINNYGLVGSYGSVQNILTVKAVSPYYVTKSTAVGGTGAVTVAWPVGHKVGDVALLFVESTGGQAVTLSKPNGFVAVSTSPQATQPTGSGASGTRLSVFWTRSTDTVMGTVIVADPGDHAYGVMLVFRNVIATGDPWDAVAGGFKTTNAASAVIPGPVTTVPQTLIVAGITKDLDATTVFASNWTNLTMSSVSERFDAGTTSGNGGGIAVVTSTKAAAGDVGPINVTVTASSNAYISLALRPQPPLVPPNPAGIIYAGARDMAAAWDLVSGATGYTLAASLYPDNPPDVYASSTTLGDLSATLDTPVLTPNVTYYLFVRSHGPGESSPWAAYLATSTLVEFDPDLAAVSSVSSDTVQLGWYENGNALNTTLYQVLLSTAADPLNPDGAVVYSSETYSLSAAISGLNPDTAYNVRVGALNNNRVPTGYTGQVSTYTLLAAAPVAAGFQQVSTGSARFEWTPNGNPSGTQYRAQVSTLVSMGSADTFDTYDTYVTTSGLAANTTYYFRVAGLGKGGALTAYTAIASTSTLARQPAGGVFSAVGESAVDFSWSADANPPGTLYRVLISTASDPLNPGSVPVSSYDTYALSVTTSGLALNTPYYFTVAAVNNNGLLSQYSAVRSTSTLAAPPSGLFFQQVSSYSARLDWAQGANPLWTGYRVAYSTASDPLNPGAALAYSYDTPQTYLAVAGLAVNATYYFKVAAISNNGLPTAYAALSTATLAAPPEGPYFTAASSYSLRLDWPAGANPYPDTLYTVAVSTAADPLNPAGAAVQQYQTNDLYAVADGLAANTTYYLRTAAVNRGGSVTAYSAAASTSTLAAIPSGFYFTGTSFDATQANWNGGSNGPGALYRIAVSTAQDPLSPAGAAVTLHDTYDIYLATAGLAHSTTYYFRGAAVNNNGLLTAYSSTAAVTTLAPGSLASPAAGSVDAVHVSSIAASWSLVSGATGYMLAASLAPDNPPTAIVASSTTIGNAAASAEVGPLAADTVYYLFARANGPLSASAWFAFPAAATRVEFQPAVTGFTSVSSASARLDWTHNGNSAGTLYRVLVSTAADPLNPAGAVVSSSDTYELYLASAGLAANTTYYFRAAGLNKQGLLTDYTAPAATATLADVPVFSGFPDVWTSSVTYSWTAGGNPAGTLYNVLVSTALDPVSPAGAVVSSSYTYALSLTTSGLASNTAYNYRVAAINHNGVATAYTLAFATTTLLADAPAFSGFSGVAADAIQFNWTDSNPGGTQYRVLVSTAPDPLNADGAAVTSSGTYITSLSSSGLVANTTYYFRVAGLNSASVPTAYTAAAGTSTLANIPLTAVSTYSAVGESGFLVSWLANANPDGTDYTVQVSTASDFNAGVVDQVTATTAPVGGTVYTFAGLTPDTLYYFQVRAVNRNGVPTDYVQLGSTRTLGLQPPVITGVTAVTLDSVTAAWELSGAATGYTLAASTSPGLLPYPVAASSLTAGGSAVLTGLAVNTTYYLFARSERLGLSSDWAAFIATSTLANPPVLAAESFTAVRYAGFDLAWDANSNPPGKTVYEVQASTAFNFNAGVTDQIIFTIVPPGAPVAQINSLNYGTYYYVRVRTIDNGGTVSPWLDLGVIRTKVLPTNHAAGDGVLFYGQDANAMPQFRNYIGASNTFSAVSDTLSGEAGRLFQIKTSPLQSTQEAVAAYVRDGTLHVLCTDGTNWSEEWTQSVGGTDASRRFDISYETSSGDVMVLYSQDQGGTNELGYRTKPGSAECGGASWSGNNNLDATGTAGVVQWAKLSSDRRASSDTLVAVWADENSKLSARIWDGSAWESEASLPGAYLETVAAAQDVEDFDAEFESISGDVLLVWSSSGVATNVNGVRYATWNGASRVWSAMATAGTFGDDATNLDLAANPDTDEMLFASIGNGANDMQAGYWSGSAWTVTTPNLEGTSSTPRAGSKQVAAGWLTSGGTKRGVVVYHDQATTNVGWFVWTGATFGTAQTDFTPTPLFATPQSYYDIKQDPVNKDRLMLTVSDPAGRLYAKRLFMTAAPAFTWTNADGGAPLETALASTTVGGYAFAYWPAPPVTTYAQSAYRFFANADSAAAGAALAADNALGAVPSAGSAFRLRLGVHVGQVDLALSGQDFKLQYAGKGDGTCAEPANGTPADYVDVSGATQIAFNDNPSVADGAALTPVAGDPAHGGHTNRAQTYAEASPFSNAVSGILRQQDGLWDLALKDNGMTPGALYCLRVVKGDGSPLNAYETYPEAVLDAPVYINEVYPTGALGEDWVELYNNTDSTPSLTGWQVQYVQNTIDLGGSPITVWTGPLGASVNAKSTFTVAIGGQDLMGAQSYHVRLLDAGGRLVDQVQWPSMSAGQSFARITDGNPDYFEVDPTPTPGYANAVATSPLKINEIAYGETGYQMVELYNTSAVSTVTLTGYALRNSAGPSRGVFKLWRTIHPKEYSLVDFNSRDADGRMFADAFGPSGLTAAGDYLTLEDAAGSTLNTVTWQADTYTRYNYRGSTVSYTAAAPGNAAYSIGRQPAEGADTGNNSADFIQTSTATVAGRNNNPSPAAANTLNYPSGEVQYLARKFPVSLTLGQAAAQGGSNIVFSRTGGLADTYSPHIYHLDEMGFDLSSLLQQTTAQMGLAFNDKDGYPLVPGTVYRLTLNTDTGAAAAPQIIREGLVYTLSVHGVAASTAAPQRMNEATRAAVVKIEVANNSQPGAPALELATVPFRLMNADLSAALTQQETRDLFNAVMLVRDSTAGVSGVYEPSVDLTTAAYVPMASISVTAGYSTLTVTAGGLAAASVPAASTGTFYLVFESTQDAASRPVNAYSVRLQPGALVVVDVSGGLAQDAAAGAQVETSSVTLIAPVQPPPNTDWPQALPPGVVSQNMPAAYINYGDTSVSSSVFVSASDGRVRAIETDGGAPRWTFATDTLSPIRTSPVAVPDAGDLFLFFADDNGDMYKVRDDQTAGTKIWKKSIGAPIRSGIMCTDWTCSQDPIFFSAGDNTLRCLLKTTGDPCSGWETPPALSAPMAGSLSIDNRDTVSSAWAALDDGRVLSFRVNDAYSATYFSDPSGLPIKSSPLLDARGASPNNSLYFTSTSGKLFARIASNLSQKPVGWEDYDAGAPIYSSPFMVVGATHLFFGDDAGRLHKVSTQGVVAAGWPFQAGGAIKGLPVMVPGGYLNPPVSANYVYFGSDDGYIYAVDAETAQLRDGWPVATGAPVRSDAIVDGDMQSVIFTSLDGKTYTLYIGP